MKSSLMRPALALALALGLTACGGGKASFPIGVSVTGLQYPGLVLAASNQELAVAPPASAGAVATASFAKPVEYGEEYLVTVKQNPAHQACGYPTNDRSHTGTAGLLAKIDVRIACALVSNTIGGTVSGLTADGLVLANGSTGGTATVAKDATTFTFTGFPVTYGVTYGVTVLTQPAGLVCSVQNGAGTMGDAAVANIAVSCVPANP